MSARPLGCPTAPAPQTSSPRAATRRGFTLAEMLVVIGIIALLIGILLPALSRVQERAKKTQTENLMQEFGKACETFQQQFGFYPGLVPEAILANDPKITSTENALLHLCGGGIASDDPNYGNTLYAAWTVINFNGPGGTTFAIKVNPQKVGEGPRIRGVQYKSFFSARLEDIAAVQGQGLTTANADPYASDTYKLPDLVDGWGQPILYMRALRPNAQFLVQGAIPTELGNMTDTVFAFQPLTPYLESVSLGYLGQSQRDNSILGSQTPEAVRRSDTLSQIIRNVNYGPAGTGSTAGFKPSLGTARGAFVLISAGRDGVFYAGRDGLGSESTPAWNIVTEAANAKGPYIANEYDDIRVFGGG